MVQLTKQEQLVLALILFLLITGWMAQAWRQSHPNSPELPPAIEGRP